MLLYPYVLRNNAFVHLQASADPLVVAVVAGGLGTGAGGRAVAWVARASGIWDRTSRVGDAGVSTGAGRHRGLGAVDLRAVDVGAVLWLATGLHVARVGDLSWGKSDSDGSLVASLSDSVGLGLASLAVAASDSLCDDLGDSDRSRAVVSRRRGCDRGNNGRRLRVNKGRGNIGRWIPAGSEVS